MNFLMRFFVWCAGIALMIWGVAHYRDSLNGFLRSVSDAVHLPLPRTLAVPCGYPIEYRIGAFDDRFHLSEADFLRALADAETLWEKPVGRDLFQYSSEGALAIHLIYDYRQEATEQLRALGIQMNDDGETYVLLKSKYEIARTQYDAGVQALDARVAQFTARRQAYDAEVARWNARGGASKKDFERLENEQMYLNQEAASINQKKQELNELASAINAIVSVLNRVAANLNINRDQFNAIGDARGRQFNEGLYTRDASGERINIYQFDNRQKLVRVLAHELGHALELEHSDNPAAIMYELNQGKNPILAESDIAALKTHCGIK